MHPLLRDRDTRTFPHSRPPRPEPGGISLSCPLKITNPPTAPTPPTFRAHCRPPRPSVPTAVPPDLRCPLPSPPLTFGARCRPPADLRCPLPSPLTFGAHCHPPDLRCPLPSPLTFCAHCRPPDLRCPLPSPLTFCAHCRPPRPSVPTAVPPTFGAHCRPPRPSVPTAVPPDLRCPLPSIALGVLSQAVAVVTGAFFPLLEPQAQTHLLRDPRRNNRQKNSDGGHHCPCH
ncbi:hypothetical protein P7K49_018914 [Saguinus oedipus]|uniref:Uncharacterized protein n=1 Tax=Saguinus oedipus TaxID=9490 RepID=A0ABQ9UVZ9_SAGOE|nr:hypothetical protein P7K49_018914 [Saguinus oedipus]